MISWLGPLVDNPEPNGQITQIVKPPPASPPKAHPVEVVAPAVVVPSPLIVIWDADDPKVVVPDKASDKEKSTSLTSWPALVGFASKSVSVIVNNPPVVVNVAEALTLPSATEDPAAVENVIVAAEANGLATKKQSKRDIAQQVLSFIINPESIQ